MISRLGERNYVTSHGRKTLCYLAWEREIMLPRLRDRNDVTSPGKKLNRPQTICLTIHQRADGANAVLILIHIIDRSSAM